ncbi:MULTISPECIES: type VI secretion system baseplate subunit TssE [unclassified Burkholderia]|uniref:type VI secretion system baseplate subunit TssE n=1 Tax=unclassified Burkholderia TaxID=2613784 RepID=UPI00075BBA38|nr:MULTISPECIES: type VI secretion system baseplate subunit TssE [unclassified Burkholderia]KUY89580.1 type VI secretion system lysozyme-like protein [Burkholderia sp. RF7-non_BP4]KUY93081.1 type VI secretion system lysozyme-like protein [Burkholderia sp. RF7-non_BP1]
MPRSLGQGSLFERLDPDLPPRRMRSRQALASERIGAIKDHLERILNSRQGSSQSCPDFGLEDLNDAAASQMDLHYQICQDVRAAVVAYEPRVQLLNVHPVTAHGQMGPLHFRLHCLVPVNDNKADVEIDLLVQHRERWIRVI